MKRTIILLLLLFNVHGSKQWEPDGKATPYMDDNEPRGNEWLKQRMIVPPENYNPYAKPGELSDWRHSWRSVYKKRVGPQKPDRLVMDVMFFTDHDRWIRLEQNAITSFLFYPFFVVWHGSSVLYQDHFNYIWRKKDPRHFANNPFSHLHYIVWEGYYRFTIIWLFMPFLFYIYWRIGRWIKRKIFG